MEIEIEVESREVRVDAEDVTGGVPSPDTLGTGRPTSEDRVVLTDRRGRATFVLNRPSRNERLDTVSIESECCTGESCQIAWSEGDPVLVSAKPGSQPYQRRDKDKIEFTVEYDFFDQYGGTLRGTDSRYTGRHNTDLTATLSYQLYDVVIPRNDDDYAVEETTGISVLGSVNMEINRRSATADIEIEIPSGFRDGYDFLVKLEPQIFSDKDDDGTLDSNEVRYVDSDLIVWIVKNAGDKDELDELGDRDLTAPHGLNPKEVELYASDNKFRTFFTLWGYDADDWFQVDGVYVDVEMFEKFWEEQVDGVEDIDVGLYSSGFSLFAIK